MVFQSYALFPHMTVLENVRYGLVVSGMAKAKADERARVALATVGLTGFDLRLPSELSGGQQQRVAVARALVLEPAVLLFDEPLSNLDARLRRQMREEIRELQQRLTLTVVYVTHDQAEAMAVSDRIIVMNKGGIAQEGAPRDLYEQPRDPFRRRIHGRRQSCPWKVDAPRRDVWRCAGGRHDADAAASRTPGRRCRRRPSAPKRSRSRPQDGAPLRATVRKAAYLGGLMEYTLESPIGELFVISTAVEEPLAVGTGVGIALAHHGVVVIPPTTG